MVPMQVLLLLLPYFHAPKRVRRHGEHVAPNSRALPFDEHLLQQQKILQNPAFCIGDNLPVIDKEKWPWHDFDKEECIEKKQMMFNTILA